MPREIRHCKLTLVIKIEYGLRLLHQIVEAPIMLPSGSPRNKYDDTFPTPQATSSSRRASRKSAHCKASSSTNVEPRSTIRGNLHHERNQSDRKVYTWNWSLTQARQLKKAWYKTPDWLIDSDLQLKWCPQCVHEGSKIVITTCMGRTEYLLS